MTSSAPSTEENWEHIENGRAAVLRLRGQSGALDIFVIYLASGDRGSRLDTMRRVAVAMKERGAVLSVMVGDFNFVTSSRDRFNKDAASWIGHGDEEKQAQFIAGFEEGFGMYELAQEHCTHEDAFARSRLDRFHTNQHLTEQLDRYYLCTALEWVKGLSAHRPISFARRRTGLQVAAKPLPTTPMNDSRWAVRVTLRYEELQFEDECIDQPLRRLVLVKQAIEEVTLAMRKEAHADATSTPDDKLGWTMRFLRAAEEVRVVAMERCLATYPVLSTLITGCNPDLRSNGGLSKVREHAIELARTAATEEMRGLESKAGGMDGEQAKRRKDHVLVRLRRLIPGAALCLKAMCDESGEVTTQPAKMAEILRKHWSGVFARKDIDETVLRRWLEDVFPDGGRGQAVIGLPPRESPEWTLQEKDVEETVNHTSDTSPGPDRIPYLAWRR